MPFIIIQLTMVAMVMIFPGLVTHYKHGESTIDPSTVDFGSGAGYGDGTYGGADAGPGFK